MALTSVSKFASNYSHCILAKFAISEKVDASKRGWADMTVEQVYEVLKRGSQYAFRFIRELLLINRGEFVYKCYISALEQCAIYLAKCADDYAHTKGITSGEIDAMPPKGALMLQVRVLVPKGDVSRVPTEVLLFVNNENKSRDEATAIEATNLHMFIQLAQAITHLVKEARGEHNPDVAMPPSVDGKLIT